MGTVNPPRPALLVLAACSQHVSALDWTRDWSANRWGPIALDSPCFEFVETDYYRASMGPALKKMFFAFSQPVDPGILPDAKLVAVRAELDYRQQARHAEPRPLNLDPGYLTESKLVLASTKDHAHRIYLRDGIYAEITLRFRGRRWQPWEWTYPDYRRADYHHFFCRCRDYLRRHLLNQAPPD